MHEAACLRDLSKYLPEVAKDAADEGWTQATLLVYAESPAAVATRLAISWSTLLGG